MLESINPATGETLARFPAHTPSEVSEKLAVATRAQQAWAQRTLDQRCALLTAVATELARRREHFAMLITLEMGKPIAEAQAEIDKCAFTCDYYARHAAAFLADETVDIPGAESKVVFDPLGLVLAVMPWNYPFWQFIRFAAPAIAAGNGAVLKHASNVPQCALALEELWRAAGAPEGLCTTLLVPASRVDGLLEDARIAAVTLTGSTEVGMTVAARAAGLMKKQVLELGGSDPFIVLADADIRAAAEAALKSRFGNAGQSCISAKRFIVVDSVADAFVDALRSKAGALKVGDPTEPGTSVGPLARPSLVRQLDDQVRRSVAAGARVVLGGAAPGGAGSFYLPTILDHVTDQMAAGIEETFGPVAAVMRVAGTEDAIRLANATEFGLAASLWTNDIGLAEQLARRIEAGAVFINTMSMSDPRLPFGGVKRSGYGRELGSHGIREFVNIKTVRRALPH